MSNDVSNYSLAIVLLVLWLCFWCCDTRFDILIAFLWLLWTRIFPRCIILDTCINEDGAKQVLTPIFFFFFPYLRLFPNNLKIPKQSLHSLDSVFCSDKFREEKIDGFESFKHGFLVFLIITVSKNYKMTSKQFSFFKTKKQFPSFAGIAAIMNIFNHSEVIEVTLSDLSNSLNRIRLIWWCNARLNNLFSLLIASVCRCF